MKSNIFTYLRHYNLNPYESLVILFGLTSPTEDENGFVTIKDAELYTGISGRLIENIIKNALYKDFIETDYKSTLAEPEKYRINKMYFLPK